MRRTRALYSSSIKVMNRRAWSRTCKAAEDGGQTQEFVKVVAMQTTTKACKILSDSVKVRHHWHDWRYCSWWQAEACGILVHCAASASMLHPWHVCHNQDPSQHLTVRESVLNLCVLLSRRLCFHTTLHQQHSGPECVCNHGSCCYFTVCKSFCTLRDMVGMSVKNTVWKA